MFNHIIAFSLKNRMLIVVAALAVWAQISILWAADRAEARDKGTVLAVLVAAIWVGTTGLMAAEHWAVRRLAVAIAIAFPACLAYLLVEEVLGGITEQWKLIFGPLLILVVLFARGGLLGLVDAIRGRLDRG